MNEILIFSTNRNNFLKEDFKQERSFSRLRKLSFEKVVSMLLTDFNASIKAKISTSVVFLARPNPPSAKNRQCQNASLFTFHFSFFIFHFSFFI
jgi:hypothetical protein